MRRALVFLFLVSSAACTSTPTNPHSQSRRGNSGRREHGAHLRAGEQVDVGAVPGDARGNGTPAGIGLNPAPGGSRRSSCTWRAAVRAGTP